MELMKASIEKFIARPSKHCNEEKVGIYLRQTERHFKQLEALYLQNSALQQA